MNKFLSKKTKPSNSILNRIDNDLTGAKFRILNEKLYTMSSKDAFEFFDDNKEDFEIYHKGFSSQVSKWPANPNDLIIRSLNQKRYKDSVIADIGCGEAKLASTLVPMGYKVYSYDLVAVNEYVTRADMKDLPLENNTCDIVVFCLSLMNKNFVQFIAEANRIMKRGGKLVVAEITSRIVDLKKFVNEFKKINFKLIKNVNVKDFFVILTFKKMGDCKEENYDNDKETYDILKPCIYKKR